MTNATLASKSLKNNHYYHWKNLCRLLGCNHVITADESNQEFVNEVHNTDIHTFHVCIIIAISKQCVVKTLLTFNVKCSMTLATSLLKCALNLRNPSREICWLLPCNYLVIIAACWVHARIDAFAILKQSFNPPLGKACFSKKLL